MDMIGLCRKNPCGPNSLCRDMKGMTACSCLPGFSGTPPNCELASDACEVSDECDANEACIEEKCINPCEMEICAVNAFCNVVHHSPMCTCATGYAGNPFKGCKPMPCKFFVCCVQ